MQGSVQNMVRTQKSDEKAKETRRKILVESTRLFARYGYHNTTVTDISKAINMTQGALFYHFPNKEAILYAVVRRLSRGFDIYRDAMGFNDPNDAVESVLASMVKHYKKEPEATLCLAVLATEFAGSGHPILDEIRRAYDSFVTPFTEILRSNPEIKNPEAASIAFIGAVQGLGIQALLRDNSQTIEEISKAFIKMLDLSPKRRTAKPGEAVLPDF